MTTTTETLTERETHVADWLIATLDIYPDGDNAAALRYHVGDVAGGGGDPKPMFKALLEVALSDSTAQHVLFAPLAWESIYPSVNWQRVCECAWGWYHTHTAGKGAHWHTKKDGDA